MSETLRREVFAECRRIEERRAAARSTGTVTTVAEKLVSEDEKPVLRFDPIALLDTRPIGATRDPCIRCGTRGDIGCKHRAPAEVRHG